MRYRAAGAIGLVVVLVLGLAAPADADPSGLALLGDLTHQSVTDPAQLQLNGHDFDDWNSSNLASGLALSGAGLTQGAPLSANAASYLETRLAPHPTVIGAAAVFAAGYPGAVTLVDWLHSIKAQRALPGGRPSQGSFHVTFLPWAVHIGVYEQSIHRVRNIADVTLAHPMIADGTTPQPIQVQRTGATLTVRAGTNAPIVVTDPEFAQQAGPWACWELYDNGSWETPARLVALWAG